MPWYVALQNDTFGMLYYFIKSYKEKSIFVGDHFEVFFFLIIAGVSNMSDPGRAFQAGSEKLKIQFSLCVPGG